MNKIYSVFKLITKYFINFFLLKKKIIFKRGLLNDILEILNIKIDNEIKFENIKKNRVDLINKAISLFEKKKCEYLEIGVDNEFVFKAIKSKNINKTGVDPVKGGTHRMTSCDFFAKNINKKFDVIFIDGMHTYEQCRLDCINSLKSSGDNSVILIHDMIPANRFEEKTPRKFKIWTGDVWKVAVELSRTKNLDFVIANIDHGVGILKKKNKWEFPINLNLKNKTFDDFYKNYYSLLPLVSYREALNFLMKNSKNY